MRPSRVWFMDRTLMAVAVVLGPLVCGCDSLEEYPDPGSVFEATFGAAPGPGVVILQAEGRAFGDHSAGFLRLKASPAAFGTLTARRFKPITAADYQVRTQAGSIQGPIPSWWAPLKDSPTVFLYGSPFHPDYTQGEAIVAYDPANQIVNFYWDGLD